MTLIDELWSGVAVAGAPSVEHELGLSHRGYLAFAFAIPLVLAAALEAGVALISDVVSRVRLVVLGQAGLAASLFFTAWTTSPWGLTFGLAIAGATSGVACGAAQALLVVEARGREERVMARWAVFACVGDVLAPLVTGAAIGLGHSYRAGMAAVGAAVLIQCLASCRLVLLRPRHPVPDASPVVAPALEPDAPVDPLRAAVRRAARMPRLWAWLVAAASCTLLDELVVALAALRLAVDAAANPAVAAFAAVPFSLGALLGSAVTDRLVLRVSARVLLVASATACALSLAALLASGGWLAAGAALFAVGFTCAPHHPLAMARAYAELPGHPGTVQALAQVFVVVDVGAPLVLGFVAGRWGLAAAIACLALQPAVIAACAAVLRRQDLTKKEDPFHV